jgi:hypothetical protein
MKDQLYAAWAVTQSAEEATKAEHWREEGAAAMMESLRARLAAGEVAASRVTALESNAEAEVLRRLEQAEALWELKKQNEILELEKQIAGIKGELKFMDVLQEAHDAAKQETVRLSEVASQLSEELAKFKEASATKTSHALGRIGEATVLEILRTRVLTRFMYSEVHDMTKVKHAGDFHLVVVGPTGKRVRIMIDVKNYATAVTLGEIEKLYGDMDGYTGVDVGLMLSLDSSISAKSQFQITKTTMNKPCMFLSFAGLDDSMREELLCWAVQVLVGVVSIQDRSDQDKMILEIQSFLADLKVSLDELDDCVKIARGLYDKLRDMRERIMTRMNSYRVTCGMDSISTAEISVGRADMQCQGNKINGGRCRSRRIPSSLYCSRHAAVEAKAVVSLEEQVDAVEHVE